MLVDTHKIYLKMCKDLAGLSKCRKIQVASMIVNNGRIISTGVNGVPSKCTDCTDHFYNHDDEQFAAVHSEWSIEHEVHAEMNALLYAAKSNVEVTSDCILYCTHEPCNNCLKHIAVTGIKQIYYIEKYYNNTVNNKYKINITQLDIDEPKIFGLKEDKTVIKRNTDADFFGHIRGNPKLSQPVPIILNGRRIFYEYGFITLNEIIKLCGFTITEENYNYYRADYRKNEVDNFKNIPPNKVLILKNEIQIRCSGSIPV